MGDASSAFTLESSEDLVVLNGVVASVGKLFMQKQKMDSTVKIAYHTIGERAADSPTTFTIVQTDMICFVVEVDSKDSKAQTFATQAPLKSWNTNATAVIWQVRWTTKGITPINAAVYTMMEVELLPGRCLPLETQCS